MEQFWRGPSPLFLRVTVQTVVDPSHPYEDDCDPLLDSFQAPRPAFMSPAVTEAHIQSTSARPLPNWVPPPHLHSPTTGVSTEEERFSDWLSL